ncbi:MAG: DUF1963 domain-containing protein [Rhizobiales bacterium]|nr:DUF1963 domain-containing protein [Hyphomicrobiales bacterium]
MSGKQGAGDWLDQAISFLFAALATFFALVVVWALTETLTPIRFQPMALRYAMVALMALAAFGMGVRAVRRTRARRPAPETDETPTTIPESRLDLVRRQLAPAAGRAPTASLSQPQQPPPPQQPMVETARWRPIVFRQIYPPPARRGLSFFGGAPVAPPDFKWPRAGAYGQGAPLHFVMQWDCAALARQDATGLLPRSGALYAFCDLSWGDDMPFRFIHADGATQDWIEATPPADLGPVYGDDGAHLVPYATPRLSKDERGAPALLPRWPFEPVAIDYPAPAPETREDEEDETSGRLYWSERPAVAEALLVAQNSLGGAAPSAQDARSRPFARPFPSFPQDWAAVRIVCADALERLHRPQYLSPYEFLPELDETARAATAAKWFQQAAEEYGRALRFSPATATSQDDADEIWAFFETIRPALEPHFDRLVGESVDATLGLSGEGARAIPGDEIARNATRHMLAVETRRREYEHEFVERSGKPREEAAALWRERLAANAVETVRDVFAPTPNRMFGPPSYVQGDVEELVDTHLLLLELGGSKSVGLELGEGVLQFMIAPDDLRAARFDRVKLIRTGY